HTDQSTFSFFIDEHGRLHPIDEADPSLSTFFVEHVPPPRQGKNFLAFVCDRELIHISRVKLYIKTTSETGEEHLRLVDPIETLKQTPTSCGVTPENPLLVTVELAPDGIGMRHRDDATRPLPLALRASRAMGGAVVGFIRKLTGSGGGTSSSDLRQRSAARAY
ncbi:hypothetical protein FRB90_008401, partial [Tulasnella sp. 427]